MEIDTAGFLQVLDFGWGSDPERVLNQYLCYLFAGRYRYCVADGNCAGIDPAALGWELKFKARDRDDACSLWQSDGAALLLSDRGKFSLVAESEALLAKLDAQLTVPPAEETGIKFGFWQNGTAGPDRSERQVDYQPWADIAANYPAAVRDALGELTKVTPETLHGKIALLYGPAGTGKTTFLRALAHAWSDWAIPEYVVDPETMLDRPAYLTQVLLNKGTAWNTQPSGARIGSMVRDTPKHRLLILEDAGELIGKNAKRETGQSLGRLLNATDGILGDGSKVITVITCNEDIGELHPAVTRPGRCLITAEIGEFSPAEASAWLGEQVPSRMSLAEMYARRYEHPVIESDAREPVGNGQYL